MKKYSCLLSIIILFLGITNAQLQFAGAGSNGTYAVNTTGNYGLLHNFPYISNSSQAPPVQGADNRIYFISYYATGSGNSIAAINADGTGFTILATMPAFSQCGLTIGPDGKLYFTNFNQKLCRINTDGTGFVQLANAPDCYQLVSDGTGWLYGLGLNNQLYKIQTDGTGLTVLKNFDPVTEGQSSGRGVGLTIAANDRIFGALSSGGPSSGGGLFSINKDGTGLVFHSNYAVYADGVNPTGSLAFQNGKIFIVTRFGGNFGKGAISSINMDGTALTKLYNFGDNTRPLIGDFQSTGLTPGNDGKLYGAASYSDTYNASLYSITEDGLTIQVLHTASPASLYFAYAYQFAPLLLNDNTNLVLFCTQQGNYSGGFMYAVEKTGTNPRALFDFGYNPDGGFVYGGLAKDASNNLYGFVQTGGTGGGGFIYKHTALGANFTKLYEFSGTAARYPNGTPLLASDGKLYGVCSMGGNLADLYNNGGAIYKMNTDGTGFALIKQFNVQPGPSYPSGALVEGPGGELYGTTRNSATGFPAIYKINKDGTGFTILRSFTSSVEGYGLNDGVTLSGSFLYGACAGGGNLGGGTIFRIGTNGTGFQVLRNLPTSGADGSTPLGGIIVASNGRIYGVNSFAGLNDNGVLYSMQTDGTGFTVHQNFSFATTGYVVQGKLLQASDGKLYGATSTGGSAFGGTLFRMNLDGTGFTVVRNISNTQTPPLGSLVEIPYTPNLPVKLVNFRVSKLNETSLLNWRTEDEAEFDYFGIERSTDGIHFSSIGRINARGGSGMVADYSFTDAVPVRGKNYYRLRIVNQDGSLQYSAIRLLDYDHKGNFIDLYPNPVHDKLVVRHNLQAASITVTVRNGAGQVLTSENRGNSSLLELDLSKYAKGVYYISISGEGMELHSSFIKGD